MLSTNKSVELLLNDGLDCSLGNLVVIPVHRRYRERALVVGDMIQHRPFSARDVFVKNVEFMARFGPLRFVRQLMISGRFHHHRQWDHYATQLSIFEYYSLDVISFLVSVAFLILTVVFLFLRCLYRRCRTSKVKRE